MAKPPGSRWDLRCIEPGKRYRPWTDVFEVDTFTTAPNPATFWTEYHAKRRLDLDPQRCERRPFIVKGAVLDSPAMSWTDE